MEEIINEKSNFFSENQKRILRLLQLTKDNKNSIIQDLRKTVVNYINETEKYISEIENDNLQLGSTVTKFESFISEEQKYLNEHSELIKKTLLLLTEENRKLRK